MEAVALPPTLSSPGSACENLIIVTTIANICHVQIFFITQLFFLGLLSILDTEQMQFM